MEQKNQLHIGSRINDNDVSAVVGWLSEITKLALNANMLAERVQLDKDIKQIEEAYESLDEKKRRLERVGVLTDATEILMSELDPEWDPAKIVPQKTNRQRLPWEHGATTNTAFDIIRDLTAPISTLELAKLTITRLGSDPEDPDLLDRVRSNLDCPPSAFNRQIGCMK
ncbi:MAG: hypothetical protein WA908_02865 [Pontixanthobacter sp.]